MGGDLVAGVIVGLVGLGVTAYKEWRENERLAARRERRRELESAPLTRDDAARLWQRLRQRSRRPS